MAPHDASDRLRRGRAPEGAPRAPEPERGVEASRLGASVSLVARGALAAIWVWQGLGPKLLASGRGERSVLEGAGVLRGAGEDVLRVAGVLEIAFGLAFLGLRRRRSLHAVNAALLVLLAVGAAVRDAAVYLQPFNPASLILGMLALSAVAWEAEREDAIRPSRGRRPPRTPRCSRRGR